MANRSDIEYLVGGEIGDCCPLVPYAPLVCEFLAALSQELRADKQANSYPDVMAFAFWCRAAHIAKLKTEFEDTGTVKRTRIGLGRVFHITPSNVPVNFGFSFVFGLLAGNANVVRVPSKHYPQTEMICAALRRVLARECFAELRRMTAFVRYDRNDSITAEYSGTCNARSIWGGT